jgi:serine/threonine protein kinase
MPYIVATHTGQLFGSITYMAPEQITGRPAADARADIFCLGCILYQFITYRLPFDGATSADRLMKIISEPPPPLKDLLSAYPPELDAIVSKALAKNREERYTSADDFALDLSQLREQLK